MPEVIEIEGTSDHERRDTGQQDRGEKPPMRTAASRIVKILPLLLVAVFETVPGEELCIFEVLRSRHFSLHTEASTLSTFVQQTCGTSSPRAKPDGFPAALLP